MNGACDERIGGYTQNQLTMRITMSPAHLPETVQTLYSELLDQVIRGEAESAASASPQGTFVSKVVKGGRYWYLQRQEAGRKRQHYLGPESPSLLTWMKEVVERRGRRAPDLRRRSEIVEMLVAGGAARESVAVVKVLGVLADCGMFRLGGVLVGTQAFRSYANILGVRLEEAALRTQDVDVAHELTLGVALDPDRPPVKALSELQTVEADFFAVPELDARRPSTSFKVRGRDLRVDFLTPGRGSEEGEPVFLPQFGVAATPLPMLGYLMTNPAQAVVLGGSGILVNVPAPGRFALHKVWLAERRPVTEQAKARKDQRQAVALLGVLLEDRPEELRQAWRALREQRREAGVVSRALARGEPGGELARAAALLERG